MVALFDSSKSRILSGAMDFSKRYWRKIISTRKKCRRLGRLVLYRIYQKSLILGVPICGTFYSDNIIDLNNVPYNYVWTRFTTNNISNMPSGVHTYGCVFFHISIGTNQSFQLLVNYENDKAWVRIKWVEWFNWKQI